MQPHSSLAAPVASLQEYCNQVIQTLSWQLICIWEICIQSNNSPKECPQWAVLRLDDISQEGLIMFFERGGINVAHFHFSGHYLLKVTGLSYE